MGYGSFISCTVALAPRTNTSKLEAKIIAMANFCLENPIGYNYGKILNYEIFLERNIMVDRASSFACNLNSKCITNGRKCWQLLDPNSFPVVPTSWFLDVYINNLILNTGEN